MRFSSTADNTCAIRCLSQDVDIPAIRSVSTVESASGTFASVARMMSGRKTSTVARSIPSMSTQREPHAPRARKWRRRARWPSATSSSVYMPSSEYKWGNSNPCRSDALRSWIRCTWIVASCGMDRPLSRLEMSRTGTPQRSRHSAYRWSRRTREGSRWLRAPGHSDCDVPLCTC